MRVLFCSQAAHTGGRVEAWLEALTAALESRGIEVFTALAKGRFHDPARYASRHRVANPIEVDGTLGIREVRIDNLLRVFERVRPDVIMPVNLADALFAAAYAKTRGAQSRLAICIHGQGNDRIEQVKQAAPFIDLAASVAKRAARQLAPIVPFVRHIPTGVPAPLQPPRVRERIAKVAYVGRLDQTEKRVLDLIGFARALPEIEIHVAGSGPEEQALRDALPNAVFHGSLSRAELYERIYPAIDAIAIFSEAEAGPIVAWEAMVHGVIPIVSDYTGRAEEGVIRDGETGIVFPIRHPNAAARKIRALESASALSLRARSELPAAYTLPAFEQAWAEALEECVGRPPRIGSISDLPSLRSPGRLARLPVGISTMARLRRFAGRRFVHHDAGSEWPH